MRCSFCGMTMDQNDEYCFECGTPVNWNPNNEEDEYFPIEDDVYDEIYDEMYDDHQVFDERFSGLDEWEDEYLDEEDDE